MTKTEARKIKVGTFVKVWWWTDNLQKKKIFQNVLLIEKRPDMSFKVFTSRGNIEVIEYDQIVSIHGQIIFPK